MLHRGSHRHIGHSLGRSNEENGVALCTHKISRYYVVGRGHGNPRVIRKFKDDFDFKKMNEKLNRKM